MLGAQQAIGDGNTQHISVALMVETILQAERAELFFSQGAVQASLNLVSELGNPLIYKGLVNVVIFVHRPILSRANVIPTNT